MQKPPEIPGLDPDLGVSLRDAMILYGNIPEPGRHWMVRQLLEIAPESLSDDQDRIIKHFGEEHDARQTVIKKLKAGKLRAVGFERGSAPDKPPVSIHLERLRFLEYDFEASSASSPGLVLDGILVFSGEFPASDLAPKNRRKPTAGKEMIRVLPDVLKESNLITRKKVFRAVLAHLQIRGDAPRGYTYNNFLKKAGSLLDDAGI